MFSTPLQSTINLATMRALEGDHLRRRSVSYWSAAWRVYKTCTLRLLHPQTLRGSALQHSDALGRRGAPVTASSLPFIHRCK